jgi:hypothetical protein
LQRKSVRGLPVYPEAQRHIRHPLAAPADGHLPQCLLQLPEKQEVSVYHAKKRDIMGQIREIYHEREGVPGYRTMKIYLERRGISLSMGTVHKYMNRELGLASLVSARFANRVNNRTVGLVTGAVLTVLGGAMLILNYWDVISQLIS